MGIVQNSIGLRWERELLANYPSLVRCVNPNLPDFHHPEGFYVEAKAGNRLWGCRVKDYQFEQESGLAQPVVYALGMHDLDNATGRVIQRTESGRQRFLDRNLQFISAYFISGVIVNKINDKERRTSAKEGVTYCMVKPSILRNVLDDRPFSRFNLIISSSARYYGFIRGDYRIGSRGNIHFMLDKSREKSAIDNLL